jgi:hypothetical protein
MTKQHAIEELTKLRDSFDVESAHARADDILILLIDDQEIRDAYEAIPKWYS